MTEYSVIINQGRVADRTDGALQGALMAGTALAEYLHRQPVVIGSPSPA